MAQIRRSIFWAAHPFVVLVSFLFSVIHLAPPAWAMTDGNTEPRQDEVTALIGELCENERFEHCLGEELQRLAQTAPEPELAPLNQLAPPPDVLLRQQPGAQTQQQPGGATQPQQAVISDSDWTPPQSTSAQPQSRPGATAQPQQALIVYPLQPQNQPALQVQPKQMPGLSQSQPALKVQPRQALLQK